MTSAKTEKTCVNQNMCFTLQASPSPFSIVQKEFGAPEQLKHGNMRDKKDSKNDDRNEENETVQQDTEREEKEKKNPPIFRLLPSYATATMRTWIR